jgi:Rrf2 family transcriptional regulator, iron-sulfur cluster assembly transcription factor
VRVTTKGRYALRAIVDLALSDDDKPVPIKKIAGREDISPEFLEQIFFKLKKAGIIRSVRGPGGGFSLNKDLKEISLKEIFDAAGEEIALAPCQLPVDSRNGNSCDREKECIIRDLWSSVTEKIQTYFEEIDLYSVVEMTRSRKHR